MVLPLTAVSVEGYRSVRRVRLPVGHLTILLGRNGVGKANRYRALKLPDMLRPQAVHELSDGTRAYLCLFTALLSYHLPGLVPLNKPKSSLHAELIRPLARLIAAASERRQIWVVTHSSAHTEALEAEARVPLRTVVKAKDGTWIEGPTITGAFRDDD